MSDLQQYLTIIIIIVDCTKEICYDVMDYSSVHWYRGSLTAMECEKELLSSRHKHLFHSTEEHFVVSIQDSQWWDITWSDTTWSRVQGTSTKFPTLESLVASLKCTLASSEIEDNSEKGIVITRAVSEVSGIMLHEPWKSYSFFF